MDLTQFPRPICFRFILAMEGFVFLFLHYFRCWRILFFQNYFSLVAAESVKSRKGSADVDYEI